MNTMYRKIITLLVTMLPIAGNAMVVYSYSSENYNDVRDFGVIPDGSYDTSMSMQINFTVDSLITASGEFTSQVISFIANDGRQTITNEDANFISFSFDLDSEGDIVSWEIAVAENNTDANAVGDLIYRSIQTTNISHIGAAFDGGDILACTALPCDSNSERDIGVAFNTPATWTATVVPIPSAIWFLGSAIASLSLIRRKQSI